MIFSRFLARRQQDGDSDRGDYRKDLRAHDLPSRCGCTILKGGIQCKIAPILTAARDACIPGRLTHRAPPRGKGLGDRLAFFVTSFVSLFAIIDAVGNVPVFLSITPHDSDSKRRETVRKASAAAFVTLSAFAFLGNSIFSFFGVTLPAFQIAGGMILTKIAFDMLEAKGVRSRHTPEEDREGVERQDVAIIPLAIPLLSGPGSISTVILLTSRARGWEGLAIIAAAITLNVILIYVILRSSVQVARLLKETGMRIFGRIMGLILAAIAVQFVLNGVQSFISTAR